MHIIYVCLFCIFSYFISSAKNIYNNINNNNVAYAFLALNVMHVSKSLNYYFVIYLFSQIWGAEMVGFDNSSYSVITSSVPAPQQETDENQTSHLGRKLSFACQAFITIMCYLLPIWVCCQDTDTQPPAPTNPLSGPITINSHWLMYELLSTLL